MMDEWTVAICATVFFLAGLLELFSVPENAKSIRFARGLCAFGFASMGALMAICVGRIMICTGILRNK